MLLDIIGGLIMLVLLLLLLTMFVGLVVWFMPEFLDNLTRCKDAWEEFRGDNDR